MPPMLSSLLVAVAAVTLAVPSPVVERATPADEARWTTVLAYDEVRVEVDAAHLGGAGPVSAWLRWTLADRVVSPSAWDAGVRSTVDAVEVDCAALASRTLVSAAYAGDGAAVETSSYTDEAAPWRRHAAASMGGRVAAAVCRLAATR